MNDRELLEMAAKAAGLAWEWNACAGGVQHIPRGLRHYVDWSPLTDDGDALRLAVKLKLDVSFYFNAVEVQATADVIACASIEAYGEDMYESTRRAITRAAAAIGAAL